MSLTIRTNSLPAEDTLGRARLNLAELPCAGAYDVVVVGAGTAGAVAAIVAGQEGLKTAMIEPQSFMGGIGTGGGIHNYYHGLQTGVQVEIDERNSAWSKRIGGKAAGFHPEAKKIALQEMADEANVECYYRAFFTGAVMDGESIVGVIIDAEPTEQTPTGTCWLKAKKVIDCTGDADVAAAAGAPFLFGRVGDGAPQPYSLAPGLIRNQDIVSSRNFDAGYTDPTNARDQTRAQVEGRSHLYREKYDAENRMIYVSPILGLRESRFIDAEYVITLEDQIEQRTFPDVIARAKAHYDNHAMDYENESDLAQRWVTVTINWRTQMCHDVPYRCMLPKKVENLIVACRAVGMTHDAHQLFRMQRDMQALGEAAAVAAAVALKDDTTFRAVNVKAVQKRLVEREALDAVTLEGRGWGTTLEPNQELRAADLDKLMGWYGKQGEGEAWNEILRRGKELHGELRERLKSEDPNKRYMAAACLALQGIADGADILRQTVKDRIVALGEAHRAMPRWHGALYALEAIDFREQGGVELALSLLKDEELKGNKAVTAIRLLGKYASADEGLEAVRAVLKRTDVDSGLGLQVSSRGQGVVASLQDRRFVMEYAAAEAFMKWNAHEDAVALLEPLTKDSRALVRRHARTLRARARAREKAAPALAK